MKSFKQNLFVQFTVVSFLVLALTAIGLVILLSDAIRSRAIEATIDEALGDASGRLLSAITPADLQEPMTGERYEIFSTFVKNSIASNRTARVKVWARDGTLIYSDDPAQVGTVFPDNRNLFEALSGNNAAEIRGTSETNEEERFAATVMEVYTPIFFAGSDTPQGAFEIYQYYLPTQQLIDEERRLVFMSVGSGFVLLYSILMLGVWRGWRTITRHREEREKAEHQARAAAKDWQTTFDSITDMVSIHDKELRLVRANRAFVQACKTRPEDFLGKPCYEVCLGTPEPPPYCPHQRTLRTGTPTSSETFEPHLGLYLEISTSPIFDQHGAVAGFVHIARDVSERKEMEDHLATSNRLASVGELASSVAHEINNPLTSVIGFSDLVLGKKDLAEDDRESLEIIRQEGKRAAHIVTNLLTLSRKPASKKELLEVNHVVETVLSARAFQQKVNNIQVEASFAPVLPKIMGDSSQLQQVFMNIVMNAEYFAKEARGKGKLTLTTGKMEDTVKVSISDDGPGITAENLKHIFDPFFTTKGAGKGTGLGLSICRRIIDEHGGRISAESQPGRGATFVVELPATQQENL